MQRPKWLKWIAWGMLILAATGTWFARVGELLPVWQTIRILGLLSYLLLCLGISLGISYRMPVWSNKQKANLYKYHASAAAGGVFCGILHALFLLADTYMPFSWMELMIPFTAPKMPILYGLGTVTLYGMLLIIFTTDIRSRLPGKVWISIHMCAYPMFLTALAHGMLGGTDTKNPWIFMMYVITFAIVLSLMVIQALLVARSRNKPGESSEYQQ